MQFQSIAQQGNYKAVDTNCQCQDKNCVIVLLICVDVFFLPLFLLLLFPTHGSNLFLLDMFNASNISRSSVITSSWKRSIILSTLFSSFVSWVFVSLTVTLKLLAWNNGKKSILLSAIYNNSTSTRDYFMDMTFTCLYAKLSIALWSFSLILSKCK